MCGAVNQGIVMCSSVKASGPGRPAGRGRGLDVLTAILDAAPATGTVLLLNAANQRQAAKYFAPVSFVVRPAQEQEKRPWIERPPGAVHVEAASIKRADVT